MVKMGTTATRPDYKYHLARSRPEVYTHRTHPGLHIIPNMSSENHVSRVMSRPNHIPAHVKIAFNSTYETFRKIFASYVGPKLEYGERMAALDFPRAQDKVGRTHDYIGGPHWDPTRVIPSNSIEQGGATPLETTRPPVRRPRQPGGGEPVATDVGMCYSLRGESECCDISKKCFRVKRLGLGHTNR